ncbi:MAG: glycosyltransferase family 2 protein [Chthoniobacterales bacterium]
MNAKGEESPLFSIITQTLNCVQKLPETVASVLMQSDDSKLFEYLLLDGGSTDGTAEMVLRSAEHESRVHGWVESDRGVYDAMNKAISRARGRFVYFLGAGDVLAQEVLGRLAQVIRQDDRQSQRERLTFYYGNVIWVGIGRYAGRFHKRRLSRQNICHQAIFYERGIFQRLGLFNLNYGACADWEMNMRCFGDARIRKIYWDFVVATYEGAGLSLLGDPNLARDLPSLIKQHLGIVPYLYSRPFPRTPAAVMRAIRKRIPR